MPWLGPGFSLFVTVPNLWLLRTFELPQNPDHACRPHPIGTLFLRG